MDLSHLSQEMHDFLTFSVPMGMIVIYLYSMKAYWDWKARQCDKEERAYLQALRDEEEASSVYASTFEPR